MQIYLNPIIPGYLDEIDTNGYRVVVRKRFSKTLFNIVVRCRVTPDYTSFSACMGFIGHFSIDIQIIC